VLKNIWRRFSFLIGKEIRRTHDIAELIESCSEIDPDFKRLYDIDVDKLTDYAVEIRYGDEFYFPTIDETRNAIEIAEKTKSIVLSKLKERGFNNQNSSWSNKIAKTKSEKRFSGLSKFVVEIICESLPSSWIDHKLSSFSDEITLFDYQQDASKSAIEFLHWFVLNHRFRSQCRIFFGGLLLWVCIRRFLGWLVSWRV